MSYRLYDKKKTDNHNPLIPVTISAADPDPTIEVSVGNAVIKVDRDTDLSMLRSIVEALS